MDVLALDLSKSATGWARYRTGDPRPTFDTWKLGNEYTDRAGAMVSLYQRLNEACAFGDPDVVYYESPLRGDQQSNETNNRMANSLAALVEFYFKCKRVRCHEANNRSWKATQLNAPSRRMSSAEWKALSIRTARELGLKPGNDNEADALHILDHGLALENIVPPWRKDPPLPLGSVG
jgi:hypothetical protein